MMEEIFILRFRPLLFVLCSPIPCLCVKEQSYYIQSSFRRITYVAVFDAPHELPDEPIVQR